MEQAPGEQNGDSCPWRRSGQPQLDLLQQPKRKHMAPQHDGPYTRTQESIKEAYNAHRGRKALVRYEDLRKTPLGTM